MSKNIRFFKHEKHKNDEKARKFKNINNKNTFVSFAYFVYFVLKIFSQLIMNCCNSGKPRQLLRRLGRRYKQVSNTEVERLPQLAAPTAWIKTGYASETYTQKELYSMD